METCDPCDKRISCHNPSDFSGGFVPTPVPSQQRVCNTEQTASCPDSSDPQVVAAGTFCITVLNPTTGSLAQAQTDTDNMALAQAQSQVGDCVTAWDDFVWVYSVTSQPAPPAPANSGSGDGPVFEMSAQGKCVPPDTAGFIDIRINGNIDYAYDAGVSHNWRITLTFADNTDQFIENAVWLFSPDDAHTIGFVESHPAFSGPQSGTVIKTIDFTTLYDGITPVHYHIMCRIQIWSGDVGLGCHARSGSVSGVITEMP